MNASEIAHELMARPRRNGSGWLVLCPVHGDKRPSLSIREGKDGKILVKCFSGCEGREILTTLREMGLLDGRTPSRPIPQAPPGNTERQADRASDLWNEAHPIESGDPVHKYLTGRGIVLDTWPGDLRSHPALDYWEPGEDGKPVLLGKWPAMLAVVRSPQGRPVGLHRTYITSDGHKAPVPAPKKIMKVHDLSGSAVRLFTPRDGALAVTEGVEDALSAWILWQIPAWATIGTSGLKGFAPPGRRERDSDSVR